MSFKLSLPYPISANRYWRTCVPKGWNRAMTFVSDEAKQYKEAVGWTAKSAGIRAPIDGFVELHVQLYPKATKTMKNPDMVRCMDLDNCLKVTIDALKGIAYADDSQVRRITAERMQPSGEGVLVVTVSALGGALI